MMCAISSPVVKKKFPDLALSNIPVVGILWNWWTSPGQAQHWAWISSQCMKESFPTRDTYILQAVMGHREIPEYISFLSDKPSEFHSTQEFAETQRLWNYKAGLLFLCVEWNRSNLEQEVSALPQDGGWGRTAEIGRPSQRLSLFYSFIWVLEGWGKRMDRGQ